MLNTIRPFAAALVLVAASAAPAVAQSNGSTNLTASQIESRLTEQGFRVIRIERDDGHYEVKAINRDGDCLELDVSRRTGAIIGSKGDDDCGVGYHEGRHDSHPRGRDR